MNERIDLPASQLKSTAYCKASRSVDCAFGSAICRANSLRRQNLLFPIYRAWTGLRALWANNTLAFLFLAAHKTRASLRLDWVPGVLRFYLQRSKDTKCDIESRATRMLASFALRTGDRSESS